ncbi:MAG: ShlB/FhaC/HecB family hemolysin secretion/activation protein [Phycisphaerae bacterium]|jgi:hemolysin activation/secretion protein
MYVLQKPKFLVLTIISLSFFVLVSFAFAGGDPNQSGSRTKTKSAEQNSDVDKEVDAKVRAALDDIKKQLREELRGEITEQLRKELGEQLRTEMRVRLTAELRAQLKREIKEELREEIRGEIIAQLTSAGIETAYIEPKYDAKEEKKLSMRKLPQTEDEYEAALSKVKEKFERAKKAGTMKPVADQKFSISKIQISGNTMIPTSELLANMPVSYKVADQKDGAVTNEEYNLAVVQGVIQRPGSKRTISQKDIQGFTRYILSVYQQKGYAGIYVYVPVKSVDGVGQLTNNVLNIQILEAKVGKVMVNNYDFNNQIRKKGVLKESALISWSPVKEGQVIDKKKLDNFIQLLNLNPDRYVASVISKSEDDPNAINLGYNVYESSPWHWYVQIDNSGNDKRRWTPRFGLVNTNLFGYDDRLNVMYQVRPASAEEMKNNYWLYGSYDFPFLSPRLRLGLFGGYTNFDITPDSKAGITFRGNGSFYGGTLRYTAFQKKDWFFDLLGSLSTQTSSIDQSLGIGSKLEIDMASIGFDIHRSGEMSSTSFGLDFTQNIGGSSGAEFNKARWKSAPNFSIYTVSASHRRFITKSKVHELSGSFKGIIPADRLPPAKMTSFGGMYSVRGYKEDGIVADGGILASVQYRFDWTRWKDPEGSKELDKNRKKMWPPKISLLAFSDYGQSRIKNRVPGEEATETLWSIGTGATVGFGKNTDVGVYFAWPLTNTESTVKGDGKWYLNFIQRW